MSNPFAQNLIFFKQYFINVGVPSLKAMHIVYTLFAYDWLGKLSAILSQLHNLIHVI